MIAVLLTVSLMFNVGQPSLRFVRGAQTNVQLAQLFLVGGRRSVREQVLCTLRLRKSDDVADRLGARHQSDDAIQAEGDAAVRRRAVLKRIEQESELLPRFFRADPE